MKKVLTLLTSFSLIATSSVLVVSCKNDELKGKLEKSKDMSKNSSKKEKNKDKDTNTMKDKLEDDQPQGNHNSNSSFSNKAINNIFSSTEDEKELIKKNYDRILKEKSGTADHILNPENPNEILVFGFEKTQNPKDGYKLKQIPTNVNKVPGVLPQKVTSLEGAFKNNINKTISGIENWDTSKIKNMYQTFYGAKNFNGDISKWKTDQVEDMNYMFFNAESFKGDLSKWKVPKSFYSNTFDKYSGIQDKTNLFPQFKK
ncbi:BspA family leucine-rich repeat surface protein [Mycoplasma mycoides subsp. capri]|uniref:BspA family leucine-rich repeat surface protein n=1 Tax=Mycoplasma mycoides TaxID=2102 RepID=UPI00223FC8DD|nr:BspA family leucine-rich repeat surface protein [Mycoplasma mycoides]QVK02167.1 BspA family leucine-rich repeat surface protein [Mycoplasma mycoides subsp. capri]